MCVLIAYDISDPSFLSSNFSTHPLLAAESGWRFSKDASVDAAVPAVPDPQVAPVGFFMDEMVSFHQFQP